MTVGACAIRTFYPPSDPERFGRWVAGDQACARHSLGYVSARQSVQGSGDLDWAVEVAFGNADLLDAWLDSFERQTLLSEGEAHRCWRCAFDLILAQGEPPPANVSVFLHSVVSGKEAEFIAAQRDLTHSSGCRCFGSTPLLALFLLIA
jgi:uncharacterized protein